MWKHENSSLFSVVEWWLTFSVLCEGEGFQRVDKLRSSCVCLYIFKYFLKSAIIKKLNKYCTIKAVFLVSWVFCICQKTHFSPRYGMYISHWNVTNKSILKQVFLLHSNKKGNLNVILEITFFFCGLLTQYSYLVLFTCY